MLTIHESYHPKPKVRLLSLQISCSIPGFWNMGTHAKILENWTTIPFQGKDKNARQEQWQIQNYKNWSNWVDTNAIILVNGACLPLQRITPVSFVATLHQNLWHLPQNISQKYIHNNNTCLHEYDRSMGHKEEKQKTKTNRTTVQHQEQSIGLHQLSGLIVFPNERSFHWQNFFICLFFAFPLCLSFQHQRGENWGWGQFKIFLSN